MLAIQDELNFPIIEQTDQILKKGIIEKASDIHFESLENFIRVRFRKDGLLYEVDRFQKKQAESVITRLKVMSHLDISEYRLPQDGRFYFLIDQNKIDCRISTCPTLYGEKVVVRLLNVDSKILPLEKLGMEDFQLELFLKAIYQPQGMILVTGPTGSGKTVTLYSALNKINHIKKNILTVEDPIEIQLPGINQLAINVKIGLTFAHALRAFLRQDPDIIMIGEIRDEETANISIRAAQTGHLVFSTLHTNNALESLFRLMNMGISGYNLASSLQLIVSQRLIRMLCQICNNPSEKTKCADCYQGYQGRTGIFELLPICDELKNLLADHRFEEIQKLISKRLLWTLEKSGRHKIQQGITSVQELKRVIRL